MRLLDFVFVLRLDYFTINITRLYAQYLSHLTFGQSSLLVFFLIMKIFTIKMREAPQRTFYAQHHFSLSQINLYMYLCFKRLRKDDKSLDDEIQVISFLFLTFQYVHPTIFLCIYLALGCSRSLLCVYFFSYWLWVV